MSITPSFFGREISMYDLRDDPVSGFSSNTSFTTNATTFANTNIDWKETPDAFIFKVDFPGLKKEEMTVEIQEEKVLQISGQRITEIIKERKNTCRRVERTSEKFLRRFRMPDNANVDKTKGRMESGVLIVTVPKEEEKKAYGRLVKITSC